MFVECPYKNVFYNVLLKNRNAFFKTFSYDNVMTLRTRCQDSERCTFMR